jgi:hypothetical protein
VSQVSLRIVMLKGITMKQFQKFQTLMNHCANNISGTRYERMDESVLFLTSNQTTSNQMKKSFTVSTFSTYISEGFFYHFADTYEEAVALAKYFYLQTGIVVAVERVAQDPSTIASNAPIL